MDGIATTATTGMTTMLLTVTPAQAAEFLKGNRNNRPLRKSYVQKLADEIRRGLWRVSHQGIALGVDGRLLDGQHRCAAIALAGVPVEMNVSFDVPDSAFVVLDSGLKRAASYALGIRSTEAGVMRWLLALSDSPVPQTSRYTTADLQEAMPWALKHVRTLIEACSTTRKVATSAPVMTGVCLRMAMADDQAPLLAAYSAFAKLDYPAMPSSVQVLERQIATGTASLVAPRVLLIKAFTAFDFDRGDKTLLVKDERVMLGRLHDLASAMRYGRPPRFSLAHLMSGFGSTS